jgi:hypothetical protein
MDRPTRPPTTPTNNPASPGPLRATPLVLAGIAGDPELSLAAKGVLLLALSHPPTARSPAPSCWPTAMRSAGRWMPPWPSWSRPAGSSPLVRAASPSARTWTTPTGNRRHDRPHTCP